MVFTRMSSTVRNILNDWSESSCDNEIEVFNTSKVKSETQTSSDYEGFSSSVETACSNLNGNKSERHLRTSTPLRNVVSVSQENITLTPIHGITEKDVDKKFFKNLLSVHNCSQTRITIKHKFTVADEVDNASRSTDATVNKVNKEKSVRSLRRRSERVKKPAARRWNTLYVTDKKLFEALITPSFEKRKRKSIAASVVDKTKDNNTSSSIRSSQESLLEPRKRRKLYSEVKWLSDLQLENSS